MSTTRKPGARERRGLSEILSEMECVADTKATEGAEGRRVAEDIRAALRYIGGTNGAMTAEQMIALTDSMDLAQALWWFIENAAEDAPGRTELFFHLRERVRLSQ